MVPAASRAMPEPWMGVGGAAWQATEAPCLEESTADRSRQIWGFELIGGARRFVRRVTVQQGERRAAEKLVYDYVPTSTVNH